MNCKKIQKLLITDYLDGELDSGVISRIEQHMADCIHCRQFEQRIVPFNGIRHIEPPARVWGSICEKITTEQMLPQGSWFEYLLEQLREFLLIHRRLAFATATAFTIMIIALMSIQGQIKTDTVGMVAEDFGLWVDEENGAIGIAIEEYFL
ncbi:zf-HC2 domain-containing protein [Candidatus Desantisbacteria bacterium]|nr:zf-HC2 domain-containing protein [Candidatus Desantisbacteria bacterium]